MNKKVCEKFMNIWEDFPDTLTNDGKYQFKDKTFLNSYCFNNECDTDLQKMNAVFFYLVNEFFGPSGVFKNIAKSNINAVEYIIIWLSHMLNLRDNTGNILTNFYNIYIKNQEKYKNTINGEGCSNYDDLIYKKNELMNITNEKLSKFYAPFKLLCEMYSAFDENKKDCTNCSGKAQEFVDIKTAQNHVQSSKRIPEHTSATNSVQTSEQNYELISAQNSEITSSSSSIGNKLFTVLSIFGAIAFLLGISYKYSLFGFRKRAQKQYLREKIKNIKKRMNH